MKFAQLALGQRFLFGGAYYVKVSPLLARAEASGDSRMIPRSAQIEPLDTQLPPQDLRAPAHAAVEDLHAAALACLESLARACAASPEVFDRARKQLALARQQALVKLDADD